MAIAQTLRALAPPGDEPYTRVRWTGPKSYTQVTAGAPPSGGDQIKASQVGVNMIVLVLGDSSYTGRFSIIPIRLSDSTWILKWVSQVTATVGGQSQTVNTEAAAATDLSGESVKLQINTLAG
jgi:hypothetical protein